MDVVDWSSVPLVEDEKTANDLRGEIALMEENNRMENERLSVLLRGCGRGRGKSPEFEFAARTILATGCSARAARDNLLVGARLFLPPCKYEVFETDMQIGKLLWSPLIYSLREILKSLMMQVC